MASGNNQINLVAAAARTGVAGPPPNTLGALLWRGVQSGQDHRATPRTVTSQFFM